jgi:hypothetical protein
MESSLDPAILAITRGHYDEARRILRDIEAQRARHLEHIITVLEYFEKHAFLDAGHKLRNMCQAPGLPDSYVQQLGKASDLTQQGRYPEAYAVVLEAGLIPSTRHLGWVHNSLRSKTPAMIAGPVERPGCITAYALLSGFGGVLAAGIALTTDLGSYVLQIYLLLVAPVLGGLSAIGLWNMREWGRKLVIGVQVTNIVFAFFGMIAGGQMGQPFVSLVIGTIIIMWMQDNKDLFKE